MSSQDERERALVREAMRRGFIFGHVSEADVAERCTEVIAAVDATHPRPTSDAAAVRAEIVAELRARATSEDITATRAIDGGHGTDGRVHDHAARVLRELADRIEAAHPRLDEPSAGLLRAVAEAVQRLHDEATAQAVMHQGDASRAYTNAANIVQRALNTEGRKIVIDRPTFGEVIVETARALGWAPATRLYTREEVERIARSAWAAGWETRTDPRCGSGAALDPAINAVIDNAVKP